MHTHTSLTDQVYDWNYVCNSDNSGLRGHYNYCVSTAQVATTSLNMGHHHHFYSSQYNQITYLPIINYNTWPAYGGGVGKFLDKVLT